MLSLEFDHIGQSFSKIYPFANFESDLKSKGMRVFVLMFVTVLIVACGKGEKGTIINDIGYPPGALVMPYEDLPGRERIVMMSGDQIISEGDYLNGLPDGVWAEYSPETGMVLNITNYVQGQKQGPAMTFHDTTGYILTRAFYNQGVLEGQYMTFESRRKVEEKNYSGGVLNGKARKFYRTGKLLEESTYVDGQIHGTAQWFDEEGNLTIQYEYDMGKFVADTTPKAEETSEED